MAGRERANAPAYKASDRPLGPVGSSPTLGMFHERRLPGAVRADQRYAVSGVDVEREPAEQGPGRVGLADVEGR